MGIIWNLVAAIVLDEIYDLNSGQIVSLFQT